MTAPILAIPFYELLLKPNIKYWPHVILTEYVTKLNIQTQRVPGLSSSSLLLLVSPLPSLSFLITIIINITIIIIIIIILLSSYYIIFVIIIIIFYFHCCYHYYCFCYFHCYCNCPNYCYYHYSYYHHYLHFAIIIIEGFRHRYGPRKMANCIAGKNYIQSVSWVCSDRTAWRLETCTELWLFLQLFGFHNTLAFNIWFVSYSTRQHAFIMYRFQNPSIKELY